MTIRNILKLLSWLGNAQPVQPIITFISEKPSLVSMVFSGALGFDVYDWQYSDNEDFSSPTSGTSNVLEVVDFGVGTFYVRVTARNTTTGETTSTVSDNITTEVTRLRSLTISANAGNGEVTITHNCTNDEPNVDYVSVRRRLIGVDSFVEIDTFTPTTTPFVDTSVTNGVSYNYILTLIPATIDFTSSNSNTDEATPEETSSQLSTPTSLNVAWDEEVGGTGIFTWNAVLNATSYDVYLDDVFVANVASATRTFTGLNVGQTYKFSVLAKAAGFNNSASAFINRKAIDPDEEFITPEQFEAEGYMKSLDGKLVLDNPLNFWDFYDEEVPNIQEAKEYYQSYVAAEIAANRFFQCPLIDYLPLDEETFEDITGLDYSSYPRGATLLVPVDNEGTTVTDVFTSADVFKRFAGLRAHRNSETGMFVDEFMPFSVSTRYANVIWQDGDTCVVDFEYNGRAAIGDPPQTLEEERGYIFADDSQAMTDTFKEWNKVGTPETIRLLPYTRSGYVFKVYVCPELDNLTVTQNTKSCLINTGTSQRARIKWGVEDYYQFTPEDGERLYTQPLSPFTFSDYTGQFITHNIQWISPHGSVPAAQSFLRVMCNGSLGGGGVFFVVNGENFAEHDELEAGYGAKEEDLFDIRYHQIKASGSYTSGNGVFNDVDEFGFVGGYNVHYSGAQAGGQGGGGSVRGGLFEFLQFFVMDFEPQERYAPNTQKFTAKFTDDYFGLAFGANANALPKHCIEITSENGNWILTRAMGGNNRTVAIFIDKFVFFSNVNRYNQFTIWNKFYSGNPSGGNYTTFTTDRDGLNTLNAKKMMFDWEIVTEKEIDGITPKLITISREYNTPTMMYTNPSIPVRMAGYDRNATRSHTAWNTVFDKLPDETDDADRQYIAQIDRRPKGWQVGDSYKICAWVEVDNLTGLAVGQPITSGSITGIIRAFDTRLHTNRVIIGSATDSFHAQATFSNGIDTYTIEDASDFDPREVYTVVRKQVGRAKSDEQLSFLDYESLVSVAQGNVFTGQSSGATGVYKGASNSVLQQTFYVRMTSVTPFQAGETVVSSNGAEFVIPANSPYQNFDTGNIHIHAFGDFGIQAGLVTGFQSGYYYYETIIYDKDLPLRINGKDETIPTFEIEVVNSEAEYLLDGTPREMRHTYRGIKRYFNNTFTRIANRRLTEGSSRNGYGAAELTAFDDNEWTKEGDANGHLFYSVGQITRMWYDGDCRSGFARVNGTAFSTNELQKYSKGVFIKNVIFPPTGAQWIAGDTGSIARQWEDTRQIYLVDTGYEASWATNEGLPNRPAVYFYGLNYLDSANTMETNLINNPSGSNNIVKNIDFSGAPFPTTIETILTNIGEIES